MAMIRTGQEELNLPQIPFVLDFRTPQNFTGGAKSG